MAPQSRATSPSFLPKMMTQLSCSSRPGALHHRMCCFDPSINKQSPHSPGCAVKALHSLTANSDGTVAGTEWGGGFTSLESLSLQNNLLTGQLPVSWASGFGNLTQLLLGGNQLSGSLPAGKPMQLLLHGPPGCVTTIAHMLSLEIASCSGSLPFSM